MPRNPRYDLLFEPVRVGPVIARNRFFQVPHCSGMGNRMPRSVAAMREAKAEGGWGVVCTEYCSIHPSADDSPFVFASLWDESDVRANAVMTEGVHRHGSLAGVELWHGGNHVVNRWSRLPILSPSGLPLHYVHPRQTRAMDRQDIKAFRGWHRAAAVRAVRAGFDIVYVYAGHGYLPMQFIARRLNHRTDEYGGSIENRSRLLRELIEDTKEAVGHKAAVAVRFAVDELIGPQGITVENEGREVIELLAELPDLWDVNISYVENDSQTARFSEEGYEERYIAFVKKMTSKPVVGVGRFTSPDAMVSQVKRGILDFIGAARPSIADPFLPRKIDEGREDEIRECIGCNICRSANNEGAPIRCTQNPTMGEEWRRGWHPERVQPAKKGKSVLVVGAGPAGLECALTLGRRGYRVQLAEAGRDPGGRINWESRLPGLASYGRVRDWRMGRIAALPNVEIYRESQLTSADVREFGIPEVVIATGARWRRDGVGHSALMGIPGVELAGVLTPDDIRAGKVPASPCLIYDDDQYYLAGVLAEKLAKDGIAVTLVTPGLEISAWCRMVDEQERVQQRLSDLNVNMLTGLHLTEILNGKARFRHIGGKESEQPWASLILVTSRLPENRLYDELTADPAALKSAGIERVTRIGDCHVPGAVVHAVYDGHKFARELDEAVEPDICRRELVALD
jgi:dimethylamine/trimethylamine dehydrogenase